MSKSANDRKNLEIPSRQTLNKLNRLVDYSKLFNKLLKEFREDKTKIVVMENKVWTFDKMLILGLQICSLSSEFESVDCKELLLYLIHHGDRISELNKLNRIDFNALAHENSGLD